MSRFLGGSAVDPLTLSAIGGVALTEGIKFLYGQAGEVLKRWREHRDKTGASVHEARLRPPVGLLDGTVEAVEPRDDISDRLEEELRQTRQLLADYADGIESVHADDRMLVEETDALRRLLEA